MLTKTDAKPVEIFWENDQRPELWPILGPTWTEYEKYARKPSFVVPY